MTGIFMKERYKMSVKFKAELPMTPRGGATYI
jgi:hypothetical protein